MTAYLQHCTWDEVRVDVMNVNPVLAQVIDALSPSKQYKLLRARYPYGSVFLDQGRFLLPGNHGDLLALDSVDTPAWIRQDYDYNHTHPAALIMDKNHEVFMKIGHRAIPFAVLKPGEMFGLWQTLDPKLPYHQKHIWSMASGARSVFVLPPISDRHSHQRLQRALDLKAPSPKTLFDHYALLSQIAASPCFPEPWSSEILYFSKHWFKALQDDAWLRFHRHLLLDGWMGTDYWRNKFIWDFTFSRAEANRNLRPNPYLADTVKCMFSIGDGACPGFKVQRNNDALPLMGLESVYQEFYQLKRYAPLVMALDYLKVNQPVYYSLQYPTALELAPRSRRLSSRMEEVREIAHVTQSVCQEMLTGDLNIEGTPIEAMARDVSFRFFHNESDKHGELLRSEEIICHDPEIDAKVHHSKGLAFPHSAPYWRASVQISRERE